MSYYIINNIELLDNNNNNKFKYGLFIEYTKFDENNDIDKKRVFIYNFKNHNKNSYYKYYKYSLFKEYFSCVKNYIIDKHIHYGDNNNNIANLIITISNNLIKYKTRINEQSGSFKLNKLLYVHKTKEFSYYGYMIFPCFTKNYMISPYKFKINTTTLQKKQIKQICSIINSNIKQYGSMNMSDLYSLIEILNNIVKKIDYNENNEITNFYKELTEYVYEPKRVENYINKYGFDDFYNVFN